MNYLAHGHLHLADPYFLAGTAVPDWLSVADRGVRARSSRATPHTNSSDPRVAAVARGIVQHHHDDAWFHQSDAFGELSWQLTLACRDALPADEGFRPSFLGHILVELLLDNALAAADPHLLERYYRALESVDPLVIQSAVNQISPAPTTRLAWFIDRFREVRFLYDYADNTRLLFRLNQVMHRVRLSPLPNSFCDVLDQARHAISARWQSLLPTNIPAHRAAS